METIFFQLYKAKEIAEETKDFPDVRKEALKNLEQYIDSGIWWKGKYARPFLANLKYKISEDGIDRVKDVSVKSPIGKASIKIEEELGYGIVYRITKSSPIEVSYIADMIANKIQLAKYNTLVLSCVSSRIGSSVSIFDYKFQECKKEMKFLRKYSVQLLEEEIRGINTIKLSYLLSLLQDNTNYGLKRRLMLSQFINGDVKEIEEEKEYV